MILSIAATEIEMKPFLAALGTLEGQSSALISGVGPVEAAIGLTRYLLESREKKKITGVMQFGIGGAYLQQDSENQARLLDICLASQEVAGDLGICYPDRLEYLPLELTGNLVYTMDTGLLSRAEVLLGARNIFPKVGNFVTVNAITGTEKRGEMLRGRWNGLCENMEGAAVARVCLEFGLPCVELRCISNFVEDRNMGKWRLQEACEQAGEAAAIVYRGLQTSQTME